jgi:hypothetical protein
MAFHNLETLATTACFVSAIEEMKNSTPNPFFQLEALDKTYNPLIHDFMAPMDILYKYYPIGVPNCNDINQRISFHFKKGIAKFMNFPHEDRLLYRSAQHFIWKEIPIPFTFFHNFIMKHIHKMQLTEQVSPYGY